MTSPYSTMPFQRAIQAVMIVVAVIVAATAAAQPSGSINGIVVDSISLQPITGATVTVEGTTIGTGTKGDGSYLLRAVPPGSVAVRVRAVGYRTRTEHVRVRPGESTPLFVGLLQAPVVQMDIVVTAGKHEQSIQEVPISTVVVGGTDGIRRSAVQLDQTLRYVPGVNLNDNQVNIRGSSGYSRGLGTRVLFLIDGIPMLSGDTQEMKLDAAPMMAIDRVEVVKGAGSALYGNTALCGVVNMVTKEPDSIAHAFFRLYGGGYPQPGHVEWQWYNGFRQLGGLDVGGTWKNETWSMMGWGGWRSNDGYRQNDDYKRWNAFAKFGHEFGGGVTGTVQLLAANDDHGNWIYWKDLAHALIVPDTATLYQRIYSFKLQTTAQVRAVINDNMVGITRIGVYRTSVDDNIDSHGADSASKLISHATLFSGEEQITHQLSSATFLTYGLQGSGTVIASNFYGDRTQWDAAVYAQVEHRPISELLFTIGCRAGVARTEDFAMDGRVDPKFGLSWQVSEATALRASAGTGFRAPSLGERFVSTRTGSLVTIPNPGLQYERSASFEIGGLHHGQWGPAAMTFDAAIFQSEYWNLIEPSFQCTLPAQIQFQSVTRARIQGVDGQVSAAFWNGAATASVAYTYMWNRSVDEDAPLKYRPRHILIAKGDFTHGALFGGVDYRFVGTIERVDDAVGACINPLTGAPVIPDFSRSVPAQVVDARVGVDLTGLIGWSLRCTLNGYNLFQYYYAEIPANIAPIRNFVFQAEVVL
jgi:outer membrane receptor for ferrienterochelin and colicins